MTRSIMHRSILPGFFLLLGDALMAQGVICEPQGNVAIYSNYDGGAITINVDQNIPDLHIGVVSYEFSRITLVGPYVSNVTAVWYAGFNADNNHCSMAPPLVTTISGAPAGTDSILIYPPATFSNVNGWSNILCNYSCDVTTNQGGCNTADQIAHFFLTHWSGTLLFHFTQYGCWGNGYNISDAGNCCANPLATEVVESTSPATGPSAVVIGDRLHVTGEGPYEIIDASGRVLITTSTPSIDISALRNGSYLVRMLTDKVTSSFVIAR